MTINGRLKACADFVTGRGTVCDVGTDHAYLPVYLILSEKCTKAIACDIHEGPLVAARRTLERSGVQDRVALLQSDGLDSVPMEDVSDVVIAGMGAELMASILSRAARKSGVNWILQPMTHVPVLRRWLYENGFEILTEKPAQEERFIYTIMQVAYSGKKTEIDSVTEHIGKIPLDEPLGRAYAKKQITRLEKAGEGLQKGSRREEAAQLLSAAKAIRLLMDGEKKG